MDNFTEYMKKFDLDEEQFLLCNHAGFEWEMIKDGKVFSSSRERNNMIGRDR